MLIDVTRNYGHWYRMTDVYGAQRMLFHLLAVGTYRASYRRHADIRGPPRFTIRPARLSKDDGAAGRGEEIVQLSHSS